MVDMEFRKNLLLHCLEFFHVCLRFSCEVHIGKCVRRYKMIMTMWNLIPHEKCTNSGASCRFLNRWREFFGGEKYRRIIRFWHVRKMVDFYFWYNQCVSRSLRKYVEKRVDKFIFINLKRWDFSGDDFGEEGGHNFG